MVGEFIVYYVSLADGRVCDHSHASLPEAYKCLHNHHGVYGEVWCEEYERRYGRFIGAHKEVDEG